MEITNQFIHDYDLAIGKLRSLYNAISDYKVVFRSAEYRLKGLWEKNKGGKMPPFNEEGYWRGKVYTEVREFENKLEMAHREAQMWANEIGIVLPFTFDDLKYWAEHPAEDEWINERNKR